MVSSIDNRPILLTGGLGYIGSHTAYCLMDAGYDVLILDNLSNSSREFVPKGAEFVEGDVGDERLVESLLAKHAISTVLHFAGSIVVPESVEKPHFYYFNNTVNAHRLIGVCLRSGVERLVFSSTAAVYGDPASLPVREGDPTVPITPYGASKLMVEQMLRDISAVSQLRHVALRYFNVAGADLKGRCGQRGENATHLIKVAAETAVGKRAHITVFGDDYDTPDGTCVRDYIHVSDLANAHLAALRYLENDGSSVTLNCGYGRGFSVKEVLEAVQRTITHPIEIEFGPRRPGDSPKLVACSERIRELLDWSPVLEDLDQIVGSAIAWEKKL